MKTLERHLHRTRKDGQRAMEKINELLSESCHLYATGANIHKID